MVGSVIERLIDLPGDDWKKVGQAVDGGRILCGSLSAEFIGCNLFCEDIELIVSKESKQC